MRGCRPLSLVEADAILQLCQASCRRPVAERLTAQFNVMLTTGIRVGECCHLHVGDVSTAGIAGSMIYVQRRHMKGKRAGRRIPICDYTRRSLQRWLDYSGLARSQPGAWLFPPTRSGNTDAPLYFWDRPVNHKSVRKMLERFITQLGLTGKISTHSFRKAFAARVYSMDRDILVVSRALGHEQLSSTIRYLGVSEEKVERAFVNFFEGG